ncbi:MAG: hypothetical protein U9Q70_10360, partial [Chloroflexota bacterium]|nr:hypothetical protein [Chloroflexota bacterium]
LSDDDWPTSLSTSSVGSLAPFASATFQISVTVPSGACGKTFDQANVTAQSQAEPSVSATSAFTTEVTTSSAMRLTPASDSRTGNPGKTVTYTLSIYNDGNITDTYNLTNTVSAWPVSFSTNPVGPVAPFSQQDFEVYVTIPSTATNGAQDVITVTASSGDLSAQSVLTTIATTQTITRGVEIAPPVASGNGAPGSVANYTLTVTNTGSITDSITLSASGNSWSTTLNPTFVSLPSMGQATVSVNVTIPSAATAGMSDTVTIQATATGVSDSSLLTTTAISNYRIYLPLVTRNYP